MTSQIATDQHSYPNIIESLILSSRLEMIGGRIEEAREILRGAKEIVIEHDVKGLENVVNNEVSKLEEDFGKMMFLVDSNSSIKEKIDQSEITDYFRRALKISSREEL